MVLIMGVCVTLPVPYNNHGCQGGNMYNTFKYVVANEGVDSQSSYNYKGRVRLIFTLKYRQCMHSTNFKVSL